MTVGMTTHTTGRISARIYICTSLFMSIPAPAHVYVHICADY